MREPSRNETKFLRPWETTWHMLTARHSLHVFHNSLQDGCFILKSRHGLLACCSPTDMSTLIWEIREWWQNIFDLPLARTRKRWMGKLTLPGRVGVFPGFALGARAGSWKGRECYWNVKISRFLAHFSANREVWRQEANAFKDLQGKILG
jgi:hypothetical protein